MALTSTATAEGNRLQSLMTGDDTRGWEGVGRLNLGGHGFCTGALISETLVLTAAHCLFDKETGARYEAEDIEFLAGWRNGRAAAYRGAKRALAHPDYSESGNDRAMDVALIELDQPIRSTSVLPFPTADMPRRGAEVGVVSYAHDRAEMPSLQDVCHVLGNVDGTMVMDCNVDYGSSGAPIFDVEDGIARIVSVVSAKAMAGETQVSLGTSLAGPLGDLRAMLDAAGDGVFSRVRPTVTVMDRDRASAATGAKFLRP